MFVTQYRSFFLLLSVLVITGLSLAKEGEYGTLTLIKGDQPGKTYPIQQALLYQKVALAYDSTAMIQNKKTAEILYYPQLTEGRENVLRIIAGTMTDTMQNYYDLYFSMGDTISQNLNWKHETNRVYLARNGKARPQKYLSKAITGDISIVNKNRNETIKGSLNLDFELVPMVRNASSQLIHLEGEFDVPVGTYQQISLATVESKKEKGKGYRKNMYLAIVFSIFILAIFGFR